MPGSLLPLANASAAENASTHKNREPTEERLLLGQRGCTPLERLTQGLLAIRRGGRRAGEQPQALREARQKSLRWQ